MVMFFLLSVGRLRDETPSPKVGVSLGWKYRRGNVRRIVDKGKISSGVPYLAAI